jgi:CubicO group peptidase (beta-lactamase class C family)
MGMLGRPTVVDPATAAAASSPGPASPTVSASTGSIVSASPAAPSVQPSASTAAPSPSASPSAGPLPPIATPPSATPELSARLDATLERMRQRQGLPGISVTILFADGSRWTGTSGDANVAARTPVGDDTAFAVASISKTFTAAAVLQLVEKGRLTLDESVAGRLPGLRLDRRITVRMLLAHTSGLHDFFFHPAIDKALLAEPGRVWTPSRTLRYVAKPYFRPGRGWHYSNTNFLVLGLLVEQVTGRTLAADVRARFLEPLGLDATYTQATEKPRGPISHGYRFTAGAARARPIDLSDGSVVMPFRSVVTAAAGAGSIASSSPDIAAWARALYGGDVLAPESLALMVDPTGSRRFKPRVPYGLGTQAVTIDGRRAVGHSGRFLGFQSVMRWLPDQQLAIVVLTNQSRRDPGVFARQLLRVVLGPPAPPVTPAPSGSPAP